MGDGRTDEVKGRIKEAAGSLSGDDKLAREGRRDQAQGKVEQAGEKAKDALGDMKDALRK